MKPFDEVKAALADELKKQGVTDKMQTLGGQIHAALEKSPGSAAGHRQAVRRGRWLR